MKILLGKKIVSVTEEDARFLEGETALDAFDRDMSFCKCLKIYFDDGSHLVVAPIMDRFGDDLIGLAVVENSDD